MTNIIVGNMVISVLTVVFSNISYIIVSNGRVALILEILIAFVSTIVYYLIGKYSYRVKIWQVIIISIVNNIIFIVAAYLKLGLLGLLSMGVSGVYVAVVISVGKEIFNMPVLMLGMCLPYALICLGIMVGRRKNREQYEVFLEIEKEQKERKKAYKEQQRKRDNGEL